jgi:ABC-2 type transport system permease protein
VFRIVFAQELRNLAGARMWWGILGLLAVLIVLAAANGGSRFARMAEGASRLNDDETTLQRGLRDAVARYEAGPQGDPPSASSPGNVGLSLLGHYARLPFPALAALSVGQADVQPGYYRVTAKPAYTFTGVSEIQNPLTQVLGSFDLAFVLVFVLPILIVASSFDLLSREKEAGTLALVAAQGVRLRTLVLAKIVARAAMILPVLLALVLLAGVIVGADLADADTLLQLLTVFAVAAAYAAFWLALAVLVNSLDWRSETNGVVLANAWLVFVVVVPAFVNVAASMLYPAPSRVELTTELREASEAADREAAQARDAYLFDHPELAGAGAPLDEFYLKVLASDAAVEKAIAPILRRFEEQAASRERVVAGLRYASPAIAAQEALNALAATDNARFGDFSRQVQDFHARWRAFFSARIARGERLRATDFDAIPAFEYRSPGYAPSRQAAALPLAFLAGSAALLLAWAAARFRRYPVV